MNIFCPYYKFFPIEKMSHASRYSFAISWKIWRMCIHTFHQIRHSHLTSPKDMFLRTSTLLNRGTGWCFSDYFLLNLFRSLIHFYRSYISSYHTSTVNKLTTISHMYHSNLRSSWTFNWMKRNLLKKHDIPSLCRKLFEYRSHFIHWG